MISHFWVPWRYLWSGGIQWKWEWWGLRVTKGSLGSSLMKIVENPWSFFLSFPKPQDDFLARFAARKNGVGQGSRFFFFKRLLECDPEVCARMSLQLSKMRLSNTNSIRSSTCRGAFPCVLLSFVILLHSFFYLFLAWFLERLET